MNASEKWALGILPVVAIVVTAWACNGDIPDEDAMCSNIPSGGCPSSFGSACDDPTCAAVYACDTSTKTWSFVEACPARDAGPDANDGAAQEAASSDAAYLRDVSDFDVPLGANGGTGCVELEPPDCPLGLALSCPADQCCGCEDLFVCSGGQWDDWGICGDGGALVPAH